MVAFMDSELWVIHGEEVRSIVPAVLPCKATRHCFAAQYPDIV